MKYIALLALLTSAACGGSSKQPASIDPVSDKATFTGDAGAVGVCVKSGCSGTVCTEEGQERMTTCQMKPEYACYQSATCERQPDGVCGWTQSDELKSCLASPPPL